MRVIALHKLPFDERRFEAEMNSVAGSPNAEALRTQFRETYENAWIVVVQDKVEIDFGAFAYSAPGPDAQAPWLERELPSSDGVFRGAFFLHYVEPTQPLWFGDREFELPRLAPAPADLIALMDYSCPD